MVQWHLHLFILVFSHMVFSLYGFRPIFSGLNFLHLSSKIFQQGRYIYWLLKASLHKIYSEKQIFVHALHAVSSPLIKAELSDCGICKAPLWFGIHFKLYVYYAYHHPTVSGGTEFCLMSAPVSEVNSFFQMGQKGQKSISRGNRSKL